MTSIMPQQGYPMQPPMGSQPAQVQPAQGYPSATQVQGTGMASMGTGGFGAPPPPGAFPPVGSPPAYGNMPQGMPQGMMQDRAREMQRLQSRLMESQQRGNDERAFRLAGMQQFMANNPMASMQDARQSVRGLQMPPGFSLPPQVQQAQQIPQQSMDQQKLQAMMEAQRAAFMQQMPQGGISSLQMDPNAQQNYGAIANLAQGVLR